MQIPDAFKKEGRTFKLMGLGKNGNVKIFDDKDSSDDTITADLDIEGYAFELIYFD